MSSLLIATRNAHKAREIRDLLGPAHVCRTLEGLAGVPAVEEDAPSFAGNALKKARVLAAWYQAGAGSSGLPPLAPPAFVLADDSGLEVDALDGAPGIHSARFAALDRPDHHGNATDEENNRKLLALLQGEEERSARFRCVVALVPVINVGSARTFEGACEGHIAEAPRGEAGFGYDPLFVPAGHEKTFAELGEAEKQRLSHRARAMEKLRRFLEDKGAKRGWPGA